MVINSRFVALSGLVAVLGCSGENKPAAGDTVSVSPPGAAAVSSSSDPRAAIFESKGGPWPLEGVEIRLRTARSHEKDCEQCQFSGSLTEEQRGRLLQIADRCPVKQTMERGIRVVNG